VVAPVQRFVQQLRTLVLPARNPHPGRTQFVLGGARGFLEGKLEQDLAQFAVAEAGADDRAVEIGVELPDLSPTARLRREDPMKLSRQGAFCKRWRGGRQRSKPIKPPQRTRLRVIEHRNLRRLTEIGSAGKERPCRRQSAFRLGGDDRTYELRVADLKIAGLRRRDRRE
jgi:hypothetical protein